MASAPEESRGAERNRARRTEPVQVQVEQGGPVLVDGPVRLAVGRRTMTVDRFRVAVCACGRSRRYPLCDGSHRRPEGNSGKGAEE